MKYYTLVVGDKELKCRLNTQQIVELEKKLGGKNVLEVMMNENMPSLNTSLIILHSSLQVLEHNYTTGKVYDLYDEYVENDKTYTDLVMEIMKILQVSGFFKKPEEGEKSKANPIQS